MALAGVVALACTLAGALVLAGQWQQPAQQALNLPTSGKTIGTLSAPVEIEEWGDFQ